MKKSSKTNSEILASVLCMGLKMEEGIFWASESIVILDRLLTSEGRVSGPVGLRR
jgi:hypothetical protein